MNVVPLTDAWDTVLTMGSALDSANIVEPGRLQAFAAGVPVTIAVHETDLGGGLGTRVWLQVQAFIATGQPDTEELFRWVAQTSGDSLFGAMWALRTAAGITVGMSQGFPADWICNGIMLPVLVASLARSAQDFQQSMPAFAG